MNFISNNFSTNTFCGMKGMRSVKMDDSEKNNILIKDALTTLSERTQKEANSGYYRPIVHLFDIAGTKNEAVFTVKHNRTAEKGKHTLTVGVRPLNTDREIQNIIKEGSKEEIVKAIENLDEEELLNTLKRLSDKSEAYNR